MQRITTATSVPDMFGPGKRGFTDGDPVSGIPTTFLNAAWFNQVQEEIANAIEGDGVGLSPAVPNQLGAALRRRALLSGATFTGPLHNENPDGLSQYGPGWIELQRQFSFIDFKEERSQDYTARLSKQPGQRLRLDNVNAASGDVLTSADLATADAAGIVQLATPAATIAGETGTRAVTPAGLSARTSTVDRTGLVELATPAETSALADASRAVTPAGLRSLVQAGARQTRAFTASRALGDFPTRTVVEVQHVVVTGTRYIDVFAACAVRNTNANTTIGMIMYISLGTGVQEEYIGCTVPTNSSIQIPMSSRRLFTGLNPATSYRVQLIVFRETDAGRTEIFDPLLVAIHE